MSVLSPQGKKYLDISLIMICAAAGLLLKDSIYYFPVKLFVVFLHEASHGIAAMVTGGSVSEILVNLQAGGECVIEGGNALATASSGYLGSILFGSVLFASSRNSILRRYVSLFTAVFLLVMMSAFVRGSFGVLSILGITLLFLLLPLFLPERAGDYYIKTVGIMSLVYSVIDISTDLFMSDSQVTDAHRLAIEAGLPVWFWSISILLISILAIIGLIYTDLKQKN